MLSPSQKGFRRGMGTIDNIYVLNYLIYKRMAGEKEKMIVMFIDLRAAFYSVDKGKLIEALMMREVREGLVKRYEGRETVNRVRGEEEGKVFGR